MAASANVAKNGSYQPKAIMAIMKAGYRKQWRNNLEMAKASIIVIMA
jgi:hypothetical protein